MLLAPCDFRRKVLKKLGKEKVVSSLGLRSNGRGSKENKDFPYNNWIPGTLRAARRDDDTKPKRGKLMKQAFINKVSSPRNVVGDLPITWSCHKKDFSLCNTTTQSAEDSRQKHSGMTSFFNVKAFTLIELLVVVLIIVFWPQ